MPKKQQYIGQYAIASQTPTENDSMIVEFAEYTTPDGQSFQPPKRVYTNEKLYHIVTDEPIDLNTLREKMYAPLISKIVESLVNYDIHVGFRGHVANDLEYVLTEVERKITQWRYTYEDRLWGAEEYEKTLRDIVLGLSDTEGTKIRELKHVKDRPVDPE